MTDDETRRRATRRGPAAGSNERVKDRDPLGRMALFSDSEPDLPPEQHLFVECSACLKETPVHPLDLVKAAFPMSIHLPGLRRYHSFMRCPACGRRTWVRVVYRS